MVQVYNSQIYLFPMKDFGFYRLKNDTRGSLTQTEISPQYSYPASIFISASILKENRYLYQLGLWSFRHSPSKL